jgi:hypothetical protein
MRIMLAVISGPSDLLHSSLKNIVSLLTGTEQYGTVGCSVVEPEPEPEPEP